MAETVTIEILGKDGISRPMAQARENVDALGKSASRSRGLLGGLGGALGRVGEIASGFVLGAGILKLGDTLMGAVSGGIAFNANMEQLEISFTTMMGSADKAKEHIAELTQFAKATPFEQEAVIKGSRQLQAYGFSASQVVPMLTSIGDAAAGLGAGSEGIDRIIRGLGQMRAKGKASAEDLGQIAELGIPVWQMLADASGMSIAQVQENVSKGAVAADKAIDAIMGGMDKRFGGLMDKQSKSFSGMMSTLKDTFSIAAGKLMAPVFNKLQPALGKLMDWLGGDAFDKVVDAVANGLGGAIDAVAKGVSLVASAVRPVLGILQQLFQYLSPGNEVDVMRAWFGGEFDPRIDEVVRSIKGIIGVVQDNLKPILFGLAAAITWTVVPSFVAWAGAATAAATATIAALSPVLVPLAAVAAAAGLLYLAWQNNFLGIQQIVERVIGTVVPFIQSQLDYVVGWVMENWPLIQKTIGTVMSAIEKVIGVVLGVITALWEGHGNQIMSIAKSVWTIVSTVISTTIKNILDVLKVVMQLITGDWEGAWGTVKGILSRTWEMIRTIIVQGASIIQSVLSLAWQAIETGVRAAWGGISGVLRGILNGIGDMIKGQINQWIDSINGLIEAVNAVSGVVGIPAIGTIPRLAAGGVIMQPGMVTVGERGPEALFLPRGAAVAPLGAAATRTPSITINVSGSVYATDLEEILVQTYYRAMARGRI